MTVKCGLSASALLLLSRSKRVQTCVEEKLVAESGSFVIALGQGLSVAV